MPDSFDFEDRQNTLEDIVRRLAGMMAEQHTKNQHVDRFIERIDGYIQEQRDINARLVAAIERLDVTQARIETLLARMIPTGENGREA